MGYGGIDLNQKKERLYLRRVRVRCRGSRNPHAVKERRAMNLAMMIRQGHGYSDGKSHERCKACWWRTRKPLHRRNLRSVSPPHL